MVLLLGGSAGWSRFSDVWQWDGAAWQQRTDIEGILPLVDATACFDSINGWLYAFGGTTGELELPGLRRLEGHRWRTLEVTGGPPWRICSQTAFDPSRRRVVLFGGSAAVNRGVMGDTWEWDGERWHDCTRADGPPGRLLHAMAHDPVRRQTVMFGGIAYDGVDEWGTVQSRVCSDTWEWDGQRWVLIPTEQCPRPRFSAAMCFCAARGRVVLFGGNAEDNQLLADTWEWDGLRWTCIEARFSPPPRMVGPLAETPDGNVLLFGGHGEPQTEYATRERG